MKHRYHLKSNKTFIEAPFTPEGRLELQSIRKRTPDYRGRRIIDLIQALPSQINVFQEYTYAHSV